MDVNQYWEDIVKQDKIVLKSYFLDSAVICWHNTNEQFTLEEFIQANCEYPGNWNGKVKRMEQFGDKIVTVTKIWTEGLSFHVTSFFLMESDKTRSLDEYWGEDGMAPDWRIEKRIGVPIR